MCFICFIASTLGTSPALAGTDLAFWAPGNQEKSATWEVKFRAETGLGGTCAVPASSLLSPQAADMLWAERLLAGSNGSAAVGAGSRTGPLVPLDWGHSKGWSPGRSLTSGEGLAHTSAEAPELHPYKWHLNPVFTNKYIALEKGGWRGQEKHVHKVV